MLTNTELIPNSISHIKFISYDGKWPNFCRGELILEIDGEKVSFRYPHFGEKCDSMYRPFWTSGGGMNPGYEGTYSGEWEIDVLKLPKQYRKYASEIDRVFNENVEWGCCGGCI